MVSGLINANPVVYEKKERRVRGAISDVDEDIKDPEHPYSLEELKVIAEDAIEVDDHRSHVDIRVAPGSHATEAAVNKQLNDKERVAAALENPSLVDMVDECLAPTFGS
ncbi:hypothetical protein F8388_014778 [Cannabis sativa]|uniref:Uncharacterized protein n=1 Tax=Cannabis sativa TaxID=3483 RepID=A0A7J6I818_CANSA|nr:hypothetical protein F8388_014778 [Cannabis sativa]KAF4403305.1 hypothetical protein G4B88_007951 [Cannabis sativa]